MIYVDGENYMRFAVLPHEEGKDEWLWNDGIPGVLSCGAKRR